jgi:hypothetical protein
VALRFDVVPNVFELAFRADQEGAADNAKERTAQEFLHAARAVGFDSLEVRITQEIEVEFLAGFEGGLRFDGVAAHAEDDHAQLVELFFCVAKLGRFRRSAGSVGFWIEKQHDALAEVVRERNIVAGVVLQAKCGGLAAYFEHASTLVIPVEDAKNRRG